MRSSSKDAMFGAHNDVPAAYWDKERALLIVEVTPGETKVSKDLDSKQK